MDRVLLKFVFERVWGNILDLLHILVDKDKGKWGQ